jgi:hypothetical protein
MNSPVNPVLIVLILAIVLPCRVKTLCGIEHCHSAARSTILCELNTPFLLWV